MNVKYIYVFLISVYIASCRANQPTPAEVSFVPKNRAMNLTITSASTTGISNYKTIIEGLELPVEWMSCTIKDHRRAVLIMHPDEVGFKTESFCDSWAAQSFLKKGFDVLGINRPGSGRTSGNLDFSGRNTLNALSAGILAAQSKNLSLKNLEGIWGYSVGASAAALFSREQPKFKWLILGGGAYDLEDVLNTTQDIITRKILQRISSTNPDGFEARSIAFDVEKLPKNIFLYHSEKDSQFSAKQAKFFYDILISVEHKAKLEILKNLNQEIPDLLHQGILDASINAILIL